MIRVLCWMSILIRDLIRVLCCGLHLFSVFRGFINLLLILFAIWDGFYESWDMFNLLHRFMEFYDGLRFCFLLLDSMRVEILLVIINLLLSAVLFFRYMRFSEDILPLQHCKTVVMVLGLLEMVFWYLDYANESWDLWWVEILFAVVRFYESWDFACDYS